MDTPNDYYEACERLEQVFDDLATMTKERDAANALLDEIGELPGGDDCETCEKVICIMQKRNESEADHE